MKNIWFVIIILIAVVGGAWYFNRNFLVKEPAKLEANKPVETKDEVVSESGSLIYTNQANGKTVLNSLNSKGEIKAIFSDALPKIKKLGFASSILAVPAISEDNNLLSLNLKDAKSEQLVKDFTPQEISISADGKKLVYVQFSNAERDFGYSLYLADRNGQNRKKIAQDDNLIRNPIFSPDGKLVYYLGEDGETVRLVKNELSTGKEIEIFDIDESVYSLTLSKERVVVSTGEEGEKTSTIKFALENGEFENILSENGIIYDPIFSADNSSIAYLLASEASNNPSGNVVIATVDGKIKKTFTKGIKILGWLP